MLEEKKNNAVFLRPRFSLEVNKSLEEIIEILKRELLTSGNKFKSKITDHHIFIDIGDKDNHFWSPQLHIEIIAIDKKSSVVKGLFGPKPSVWTFFMFLHFVLGISFLSFISMLYVNYSLDKSLLLPLLLTIILPILWFLLYFIGRLGRDFGRKQMKELHDFLLASIDQ